MEIAIIDQYGNPVSLERLIADKNEDGAKDFVLSQLDDIVDLQGFTVICKPSKPE